MPNPCVQIINVSKKFAKKEVIINFSLTVNTGEIVGLIGPNGAGKTTLLRIIATVLTPKKGQLFLMGVNTQQAGSGLRQNIGYMPEDAGLYLRLSALENLRFFLSFYFTLNKVRIIENYLKKFNLWHSKDVPVGEYSQGMKRKLLFIRSILHDPSILLLDEPFISMDPQSRLLCIEIFKEWRDKNNKCILVSSHSLTELENICDRVVFISDGKKLLDENINILRKTSRKPMIKNLEDIYMDLLSK